MIIVSQDKKRTVENLNLGIRNEGEYNKNYTIYNTEIGEDLGEYATEERAKEILQDIIKEYRHYRTAECDGYTNVLEETAVYEMPEE